MLELREAGERRVREAEVNHFLDAALLQNHGHTPRVNAFLS